MQPGELRPVLEVDPHTGLQIRNWIGPTSFVKEMGRACRRVTRINVPATTTLYSIDRRDVAGFF
jgi:hypothetical protein